MTDKPDDVERLRAAVNRLVSSIIKRFAISNFYKDDCIAEVMALLREAFALGREVGAATPADHDACERRISELEDKLAQAEYANEVIRDDNGMRDYYQRELAAAEARVKELERALTPFALLAESYDRDNEECGRYPDKARLELRTPTIGQLREARKALVTEPPK